MDGELTVAKYEKYQIRCNVFILCSDLKWRHSGFHAGESFTADECEYILDGWEQKGIDTGNIELIEV